MKRKDFRLMRNLCMRALKSTASKIMLGAIIGSSVGYACRDYYGDRDFEAACLFADIIHSAMDMEDPIGMEVEEHYYEWVQSSDFEDLNFKNLKYEDLETYSWCY